MRFREFAYQGPLVITLVFGLAQYGLNLSCRNPVPTFPQRSPASLLTTAACGGLRSTPDCRPRRTSLHLSYSCGAPFGPAIREAQDPFQTSAALIPGWLIPPRRKSTETQFHPGSNPLAFNRGAASGPVRNLMSEFAASGDLLAAPIAAAKTVVVARSPGNGPSNCAPATGTISEPCAIPSSASPLATTAGA